MTTKEAHNERHAEYRRIAKQIRDIRKELVLQKGELKTHPMKPRGGAHPGREWRKIKFLYHEERAELCDQLDALEEARARVMEEMRADPFPVYGLTWLLTKLADVEAAMSDGDTDDAWDRISQLMDWLEEDENRIYEIQENTK